MKDKISPELSDKVAETLMITLAMKCRETSHKKSIFQDPKSCEMVGKLDYDFSKFRGGIFSAAGVVLRAKDFDKICQCFIIKHRNPVVVILGCGLDTRYHRIAERRNAIFYELDLPEVIDLRKKLLPAEKNQHYIPQSMFETAWISDLKMRHPNGEFLFLVEGVLMYFPENDVKKFLQNLSESFIGAQIYMDVITKFVVRNTKNHDTVSKTKAKFQWGCDNLQEIEAWSNRIKLKSQFYFTTEGKGHWPVAQFFMKLIPKMGKATRNALFEFQ